MRTLFAATAACVMGLMSVPAMAQAKIGTIDFQRAIVDTAEFKKAYSGLEAKYKPMQDQLQKSQQELADIETTLRNSQGQLSPAGAAELQAKGQRKQTQVERLTQDLQEEFEAERDSALRLVGNRMTDVLKKVLDEKQLDLIIDTQALRASKPTMDVTDAAVAAYDAAHPAK
jgi:outer membrane protein